jgi:small subunit ribosomal protein S1
MVLPLRYPVGTRLAGKVRNLTSFGAFVEIEAGIDGLIHISDMSWTKRVQHPSEVVKKGDAVDVIILNIDPDNKRISLGLKQATEDPWLTIGEKMPLGTEIRAMVLRPVDKGLVVDLGDDIEGFAPVSQMGIGQDANPEDVVVPNQIVVTRVIEVDPIHHRIVVAIIEYPEDGIPAPGTAPATFAEIVQPVIEDDDEDEDEE